jgi:hypothetical protein
MSRAAAAVIVCLWVASLALTVWLGTKWFATR